ncbi:MAG: queuosine salvage family protein [bacterium]|nr:queuosine salvage family protein [bacterium]
MAAAYARQAVTAENATSLPAKVRQDAAWVMGQAEFISIDMPRIAEYTAGLLEKYPLITTLEQDHHFHAHNAPEKTAAYIFALDSVNFGSGYFKVAEVCGIEMEYNQIAGALKNAFAANRLSLPVQWASATPQECHEVFGVPQGRHEKIDTLMALFAAHLQETGRRIIADHGGSVMKLLAAAENSATALVNIIGAWPTFRDVTDYKGREVAVYKRAQILAADIFLALQGQAPAAFADMADLTIFADNMVPHVLRHDGILKYAPALAEKIDNGVMIESGSAEETEIRMAGIHAVECMKNAAAGEGSRVTSVNLDHILWNRGYEAGIYALPTHRTWSVWY